MPIVGAWQYSKNSSGFGTKDKKTTEKSINLYNETQDLIHKKEPPDFYKNNHCPECQYWQSCSQSLKARDCISLLGGITAKVMSKYHSKGIFTILQLSHLFRLRRKRSPKVTGRFLWELKALAIWENKTYILQIPSLAEYPAIYIDFEGLPEENFIYLIGVHIKQKKGYEQLFSFWVDNKDSEVVIFHQLFALLLQYPEACIYHYGSYETKAAKKMALQTDKEDIAAIEKRMFNLLYIFRTHVYPPTYTNSLKEIAAFIGYKWSTVDATGIDSITWRKQWEATAIESCKEKLIQYNLDDCIALSKVHAWLGQLLVDENAKVQQVSKMRKHTPYHLQANTEFSEDFQYINKAAYFDYQRSKIYWKSDTKHSPLLASEKKLPIRHAGRGVHVWQPKKANEIIQHPALPQCPGCGNPKVYHSAKQRSFIKTDLKFSQSGIRQWVIEYRSGSGKCAKCNMKYNDSILKQSPFGDNIFAWSINMYVCYQVSYAMISRLLMEQFGIWANPVYFNDRNYKWWQRFKPDVEYCRKIILNSPVIHIDETTVKLAKGLDKGYVWVFASLDTVFYYFSENRETTFLHEWFKDYKGVIITDFFPGYESLPIKQQKCIIHLIRDLNDDLLKAPFDTEYKSIVDAFGQLIKKIVLTIDKYGLKSRHLKKHITEIEKFHKEILECKHTSDMSVKYAKRLKKNWKVLWTFLSHDNVPWNNNNAEAAVKAFAQHRRRVNGQVSKNGLTEYLGMLTIAQTCRYRNTSFLDFLRGKAGIWQQIDTKILPDYLSFNQARLFVHKLKLENKEEYDQWKMVRKNQFIPHDPDNHYINDGWLSWEDWLGTSR